MQKYGHDVWEDTACSTTHGFKHPWGSWNISPIDKGRAGYCTTQARGEQQETAQAQFKDLEVKESGKDIITTVYWHDRRVRTAQMGNSWRLTPGVKSQLGPNWKWAQWDVKQRQEGSSKQWTQYEDKMSHSICEEF
jgi:hypothetical protein